MVQLQNKRTRSYPQRGRGNPVRRRKKTSSQSRQQLTNYKGNANVQTTKSSNQVFVSNLASEITQVDLREIFTGIGTIKKITLNFDENGISRGTAVIVFGNPEMALEAVREYDR